MKLDFLDNIVDDSTKANIIAEVLGEIYGETPSVIPYPDYYSIQWTESQQEKIIPIIESQLKAGIDKASAGKAGKIRIDYMPIVKKMTIKKVLPSALGLVGLGFLGGKLL